jgi:hypothetical protein
MVIWRGRCSLAGAIDGILASKTQALVLERTCKNPGNAETQRDALHQEISRIMLSGWLS